MQRLQVPSTGAFNRLLWDVSGAFGDIGVLFPIAVALIIKSGFDPADLFLMAGLFYILSAFYFKITMPVQPLKAMFAIALATGLGAEVISAAGLVMGLLLLFLALTGFSEWLGGIFPLSVIRGIQLGLGFLLVKTSLGLMHADLLMAVVSGTILLACIMLFKKIPPLIPLLILGLGFSLSGMTPRPLFHGSFLPKLPDLEHIRIGFITLVIPQLALTFGNAVVATEATGKLLYGEKAARLNLKSIPLSMGLANIISGIMGGIPMCHGSGGLTAHFKFGATGPRSGYIIGLTLTAFALISGDAALSFVAAFPTAILGVLLCYVGIEHAMFVRDIMGNKRAVVVAAVVALVGLVTNNLTLGFFVGGACHYALMGLKALAKDQE